MTKDEARISRTQSVFRHVNERIAEAAVRFDAEDAEFVCECAAAECHHRVAARLDDYEQVRAEPTRFLVAEGHEAPAYEHVRERRAGYLVVEKVARAVAAAVRRSDPRANPA